MAASLNEIGTVQALEAIKKSLVPEVKSHQEILRDDDWDNRWNWDSNELAYENTNKEEEQDRLWLEDCKLALSPLADMFVVGRGQVVAIYQSKTTPSGHEDERAEFELIYTLNLAGEFLGNLLYNFTKFEFVSRPFKGRDNNLDSVATIRIATKNFGQPARLDGNLGGLHQWLFSYLRRKWKIIDGALISRRAGDQTTLSDIFHQHIAERSTR